MWNRRPGGLSARFSEGLRACFRCFPFKTAGGYVHSWNIKIYGRLSAWLSKLAMALDAKQAQIDSKLRGKPNTFALGLQLPCERVELDCLSLLLLWHYTEMVHLTLVEKYSSCLAW